MEDLVNLNNAAALLAEMLNLAAPRARALRAAKH